MTYFRVIPGYGLGAIAPNKRIGEGVEGTNLNNELAALVDNDKRLYRSICRTCVMSWSANPSVPLRVEGDNTLKVFRSGTYLVEAHEPFLSVWAIARTVKTNSSVNVLSSEITFKLFDDNEDGTFDTIPFDEYTFTFDTDSTALALQEYTFDLSGKSGKWIKVVCYVNTVDSGLVEEPFLIVSQVGARETLAPNP